MGRRNPVDTSRYPRVVCDYHIDTFDPHTTTLTGVRVIPYKGAPQGEVRFLIDTDTIPRHDPSMWSEERIDAHMANHRAPVFVNVTNPVLVKRCIEAVNTWPRGEDLGG